MKKLIILLTLVSFIQPLDLLAKERSEHREKKTQRQSQQVKSSREQPRQQKQTRQKEHKKSQNPNRRQATVNSRNNRKQASQNSQQRQATVRSKERIYDTPNRNQAVKSDKKYNRANKHSNRQTADRATRSSKRVANKRHDTHRYSKQKHRRHNTVYRDQHRRFNYDHYRGSHQYGKWHAGHGHNHYDYRYRYTYNPYQWYDDYYYHSYFDWRWGRVSYGSYSHDYYDPYYCPDGFTEFVAGLAVGALIYSW